MTTYMLVDTTPMALPRGVYDSLEDLARALGMTEAQLMAQTNARGSWGRLFRLGKEPVRIVCVREKQEKRNIWFTAGSSQVDKEILPHESSGNSREAATVSTHGYQNYK